MSGGHDFDVDAGRAADPLFHGKTRITIRLDDVVLDWFRARAAKAGRGNYQTLINTALREYMRQQQEPLEEMLRRVLREELGRAAAGMGAEGGESSPGDERGDD